MNTGYWYWIGIGNTTLYTDWMIRNQNIWIIPACNLEIISNYT